MESNHEYKIMKYFSATFCQNVVPQNKMEIIKLCKKVNDRNLDGIFRLISLTYGKNMKKYVSKFMQNIFKKFHNKR